LEQEPSALQVFLEKSPPLPHFCPSLLGSPGEQVNCLLILLFVHFGLFVHLDVAFPQTAPTLRLVQKGVQHLVLGTAAPASHSSVLSRAPFPQTGLDAPD